MAKENYRAGVFFSRQRRPARRESARFLTPHVHIPLSGPHLPTPVFNARRPACAARHKASTFRLVHPIPRALRTPPRIHSPCHPIHSRRKNHPLFPKKRAANRVNRPL